MKRKSDLKEREKPDSFCKRGAEGSFCKKDAESNLCDAKIPSNFGADEKQRSDPKGQSYDRRQNILRGGSFKTLGLDRKLVYNIPFNTPTPIQRKTLPCILEGKSIMGIARTGSGKTLCYLLPAIQRAINGENSLILLPTKELVCQVKRIYKRLTFKVDVAGSVEITTLREMDAKDIHFLVVDEIDRVLEEKSLLAHFEKISEGLECQKVYFSATLPNQPVDAKIIQIDNKIPETIKHTFLFVPGECKDAALVSILDEGRKSIIFTATKYGVDYVLSAMQKYGFYGKGIYSSMDDEARKANFEKFLRGEFNFLVVTDVAARGLDIPHLDVSISYDLSDEKTFVHRVGRVRGMGFQFSLVTYSDVFHFFNIRETHLPNVEIGTVPQHVLDTYEFSNLSDLKFSATRGYQRCLDFRSKVSVPSDFKLDIDSFKVHSRYATKDTLASQIKTLKARKPVKIEENKEENRFKDQFYIPYSRKGMKSHSSAYGISKDDYRKEIREKIRRKTYYKNGSNKAGGNRRNGGDRGGNQHKVGAKE